MNRDYRQIEKNIVFSLALKNLFGKRILEIGCGSGHFSKMLASIAGSLTAIDINEEKLSIARKETLNYPIRPEFRCLGGEDLSVFPGDFFDAVFFSYSLHHHANPERALFEALRVLRKEGRLILIEPRADGDYCRFLEPIIDEKKPLAEVDCLLSHFSGQSHSLEYLVDWLFQDRQDLLRSLRLMNQGSETIWQEMAEVYPADAPFIIKDKAILWILIKSDKLP